ncbi:hypothetical protein KY363_05690 [Candidatus Woesearchaeota archaeon]|nr:hypothetical protein [Candidatus Woesearchaeota archaeon]
MAKKKEKEVCCHEQPPIWAVMFVVIGTVWIAEFYLRMDIPLVAILLVIIGLYYLIKRRI